MYVCWFIIFFLMNISTKGREKRFRSAHKSHLKLNFPIFFRKSAELRLNSDILNRYLNLSRATKDFKNFFHERSMETAESV